MEPTFYALMTVLNTEHFISSARHDVRLILFSKIEKIDKMCNLSSICKNHLKDVCVCAYNNTLILNLFIYYT